MLLYSSQSHYQANHYTTSVKPFAACTCAGGTQALESAKYLHHSGIPIMLNVAGILEITTQRQSADLHPGHLAASSAWLYWFMDDADIPGSIL